MQAKSKCLNCGSNEIEVVFSARNPRSQGDQCENYSYALCKRCDLLFIDPLPSQEVLEQIYTYEYDAPEKPLNPVLYEVIMSSAGKMLLEGFSRIVNWRRVKSVSRLNSGPNSRILDVGCGHGIFLATMEKLGYDVYGCEVSRRVGIEARKRIGDNKVSINRLENCGFPKETFDCITMWHVMEHVENPESLIMEIKRILKAGGSLVLEVPNRNSLALKVFGRFWTLLLIPEHLHFWSERSLELLLESKGFAIEKVCYPAVFPFTFATSCAKYSSERSRLRLAAFIGFVISLPISVFLSIIGSPAKTGEVVQVIARKHASG